MSPSEYNLDYLHDALLVVVSYFVADDGRKQLLLRVECHPDCGYDDWNGRTLEVLFEDVTLVQGQLYGDALGEEYVNFIDSGLLEAAASTVKRQVDAGLTEPNECVTVVLQSGSEVSIACKSITVKLLD